MLKIYIYIYVHILLKKNIYNYTLYVKEEVMSSFLMAAFEG